MRTLFILILALLFVGCSNTPSASTIQPVESQPQADNTTKATQEENVTDVQADDEDTTEEIDTSDWQTYTNEEYDYSIKYPADWIYFNTINENGELTYDETISLESIRFTNQSNKTSENSFVDFTVYFDTESQVVQFAESIWADKETQKITNQMKKTLVEK